MMASMTLDEVRTDATTPLPVVVQMMAFVGMGTALYGVYWDDAWHTDRGRDSLFSPPHVALYSGVALTVLIVAVWAVRNWHGGWRRFMVGPSGIGVIGASAVLGSAPLDEWWHRTFGRDAVLWSPPHLFAVVGTIALATAFALLAHGSDHQRRWFPSLQNAAGAPVVGAWMVLVLEYDTDVAQFSPVWYLPVTATALCAAALTVQAANGSTQFAATKAGIVYTTAMVAVTAVLASGGLSTPIIPAVLPALFVADLTARRHWHGLTRTIAFCVAVFGVYVPYLRLVPGGVAPSASDVLVGFPLAMVGVAVTIAGFDRRSHWRVATTRALAVIVMIALASIVAPSRADAHDPGQGTEITSVTIRAAVTGNEVVIEAHDLDSRFDLQPKEIVARRAGRTLHAPLSSTTQGWAGQIELDREGRWFVYVTALVNDAADDAASGSLLEAWIPVIAGTEQVETKHTMMYRPAGERSSQWQIAAGVLIGAASLGTLVGVGRIVRLRRPDQ